MEPYARRATKLGDEAAHAAMSRSFSFKSQNNICSEKRADSGITMSNESFHFQLGAFNCMVVNDGNSVYSDPAQVFFVNAPREHLKKVLMDHNLDISKWKEYVSPYSSLLINTGQHRVLVDTGEGNLEPTTGRLIPNLRAEGITGFLDLQSGPEGIGHK